MSKTDSIHPFLVIEGNIGAGKTTLCKMMAQQRGSRLLLEQFTDNPFLPEFYKNPDRYAFPVELFFMTERHKQLQQELSQLDLFQESVIADYIFYKTLLFARNNLNTEEYRLFQRLFNVLNAAFPKPGLLVYLHRPVEHLLANIRKRGRSYEQEISPEYLLNIQQAYFEFFRTNPQLPILVIDLEDVDFISDPVYYQRLVDCVDRVYLPGVHRVGGL